MIDGPLEENAATVGASASAPVTVRAGSILATGELLEIVRIMGERLELVAEGLNQPGDSGFRIGQYREECNSVIYLASPM